MSRKKIKEKKMEKKIRKHTLTACEAGYKFVLPRTAKKKPAADEYSVAYELNCNEYKPERSQ